MIRIIENDEKKWNFVKHFQRPLLGTNIRKNDISNNLIELIKEIFKKI